VHEVIPITESHGLWHPQEGVVNGHFNPGESERIRKVGQLRRGVAHAVEDARYTPDAARRYTVADLITGWGVAESVRHQQRLWGRELQGKRVVVQGWGNVGATAAYYLAQAGAQVVGIIDREGGLLRPEGFTFDEVKALFLGRRGNQLAAEGLLSFDEINRRIWSVGAEIFLPCAASRLVTREQVDALVAGGLEVIACGANVAFADSEIFYGPIQEHADSRVAVIPDFIANCGMARAFAYLMGEAADGDTALFEDVSRTIFTALQRCRERSAQPTGLARTAYALTLDQLV
jgi:glutamate dehydrogenase (NAD(P)+)